MLFPGQRGAAAPDIAGEGLDFLERNHFHMLVAGHGGEFLEVQLGGAGNAGFEDSGLVAPDDQRFEDLLHGHAERAGHCRGGEVGLVVGGLMQFVINAQLVEEAGCVGFLGRHTVNLLSGEAAGDAPADGHEIKVVSDPVQMDAVRCEDCIRVRELVKDKPFHVDEHDALHP